MKWWSQCIKSYYIWIVWLRLKESGLPNIFPILHLKFHLTIMFLHDFDVQFFNRIFLIISILLKLQKKKKKVICFKCISHRVDNQTIQRLLSSLPEVAYVKEWLYLIFQSNIIQSRLFALIPHLLIFSLPSVSFLKFCMLPAFTLSICLFQSSTTLILKQHFPTSFNALFLVF